MWARLQSALLCRLLPSDLRLSCTSLIASPKHHTLSKETQSAKLLANLRWHLLRPESRLLNCKPNSNMKRQNVWPLKSKWLSWSSPFTNEDNCITNKLIVLNIGHCCSTDLASSIRIKDSSNEGINLYFIVTSRGKILKSCSMYKIEGLKSVKSSAVV